jgi:hypothetical protein
MEPKSSKVWASAMVAVLVVALAAGPALAEAEKQGERQIRIDALTEAVGRPLDGSTVTAWLASLTGSVGRPVDQAKVDEYLASVTASDDQAADTEMDAYLASLSDAVGRPVDSRTVGAWVASLAESVGRPIDPELVAEYLATAAGSEALIQSSSETRTPQASGDPNFTGIAIASLVFAFAIGAAVIYRRQRRDHTAPA